MRSILPPLVLATALSCTSLPERAEPEAAEPPPPVPTLADWLAAPTVPADPQLAADVLRFYVLRGHRPAFVGDDGPLATATALLDLLEAAGDHGLDPEAYGVARLRRHLTDLAGEPADRLALEVALTEAALRYAGHLAHGRLPPIRRWEVAPPPRDLPSALAAVIEGEELSRLQELAPSHPQYAQLRKALERHRTIAAAGGWPDLPPDVDLREGQPASPEVLVPLVHRLAAGGWLGAHDAPLVDGGRPLAVDGAGEADDYAHVGPPPLYAGPVVDAVRRFQAAHGLGADGAVGPATVEALTVPLDERIAALERNLDRWRWLPHDLGPDHVRVNLPSFELEVVRGDQPVTRMAVVIGTPHNATPVFSDAIERIVLNPYWNVPVSIGGGELLPKARRNPGWLSANGYEVIDRRGRRLDPRAVNWSRASASSVRFRQRPGRGNALGTIKFRFPNDHAVYLHDTPSKHLFARPRRAFSHGCVRVSEPWHLADLLLDDWSEEEVEQAIGTRRHRVVELPDPVPVYLLYFTAEVGDDGGIRFLPDVYGLDRVHRDAVEATLPRPEGARPAG